MIIDEAFVALLRDIGAFALVLIVVAGAAANSIIAHSRIAILSEKTNTKIAELDVSMRKEAQKREHELSDKLLEVTKELGETKRALDSVTLQFEHYKKSSHYDAEKVRLQIDFMQAQIKALEQEHAKDINVIKQMSQEIERLTKERDQAQADGKVKEQRIASLEERIAELEAREQVLRADIDRIRSQGITKESSSD